MIHDPQAKSTTERFAALFTGLPRAYGTYKVPPDTQPDAAGKLRGKAETITTGTVTDALWAAHLSFPRYLWSGPVGHPADARGVFGLCRGCEEIAILLFEANRLHAGARGDEEEDTCEA